MEIKNVKNWTYQGIEIEPLFGAPEGHHGFSITCPQGQIHMAGDFQLDIEALTELFNGASSISHIDQKEDHSVQTHLVAKDGGTTVLTLKTGVDGGVLIEE